MICKLVRMFCKWKTPFLVKTSICAMKYAKRGLCDGSVSNFTVYA